MTRKPYNVSSPARLKDKHVMRLMDVLKASPYENVRCPAAEPYEDGEFLQIIFDARFTFLGQDFLVAFLLDSRLTGGNNRVREARKRAAAAELGLPLIELSRHSTSEEIRFGLIRGVMKVLGERAVGSGLLG